MTSSRPWRPAVRTGLGTAAMASVFVLASCTSSDDDEGAAPGPEPEPEETVQLDLPSHSESDPDSGTGSGGEAESAEPTSPPTTAAPDMSRPGGDGTPPPTTAAPTPGSGGTASPRAAAAPARSVTVTSPADGAEVSGSVVFEVEVSGFTLTELTGQMSEDEGHLYAFVDEEPPSERARLPSSESIVTSDDTSIELGELEPGKHTVTVLATHAYPVPFEPRVHDTVTFTVRD